MGKAEIGSVKYLNKKMKEKGLNRLRWYCSICQRSLRDENAWKMHCQSPSHVQKAGEAGQDFKRVQEDFSQEFLRNFVQTLKTEHGEKEIHINRFYQTVIADRHHIHMNATKWNSLTEFAKYLGREGICRVVEKEDGIFVSWIDDSPEAMKRKEALRRKELQDKGDEAREQTMLQAQIQRAQKDAQARGIVLDEEEETEARELKRQEGELVKLSFRANPASKQPQKLSVSGAGCSRPDHAQTDSKQEVASGVMDQHFKERPYETATKPVSLKFGFKPQSKNVLKNTLSGGSKKVMVVQPKKVSEAERIMKEELERKRAREGGGGGPNKKMRLWERG